MSAGGVEESVIGEGAEGGSGEGVAGGDGGVEGVTVHGVEEGGGVSDAGGGVRINGGEGGVGSEKRGAVRLDSRGKEMCVEVYYQKTPFNPPLRKGENL